MDVALESDIEQATQLSRRMVTRWGMSDRLGMVQLAPRDTPYLGPAGAYGGAKPFSEETASVVGAEVTRIIQESHDEAKRLLTEHRAALDALASALLDRETLDEQEVLQVTKCWDTQSRLLARRGREHECPAGATTLDLADWLILECRG